MDTLFYRILLLFVGLAFLFIQSGEYKSFKIKVVVLPQFVDFAKWASFVSLPLKAQVQAYPSPLLIMDWSVLRAMPKDRLERLKKALKQKNQSLLVVYSVFEHVWRETPTDWKACQSLPISYWEFSAAHPDTISDEWQVSLLPEFVRAFDVLVEQLKVDFPSAQYFAWGAFKNPSKPIHQIWNHLLASQQKNIHGYTLIIDRLDLQTFRSLLTLKTTLAYPHSRANSLGLHLKNTSNDSESELTSLVFLLNTLMGLPVGYVSYQKVGLDTSVVTVDALLSRLLWRRPRLQALRFRADSVLNRQDLHGWYWQKRWETGAILVNLGDETQKIYTEDLFPSFFYQEVFTISAQSHEQITVQRSEGFHKVVLPPQSVVFLGSKQILPYLSHTVLEKSLSLDIELVAPAQLKITYHLAETTQRIGIRILDMYGQECYTWHQKHAKSGYYALHHQIKHLPRGQYLCSIQVGQENLLYSFQIYQDIQT